MKQALLQLSGDSLDALEDLHAFFDRFGPEAGWPDKLSRELLLCCEELLTNTISYGYANHPPSEARRIQLSVISAPDGVTIELTDNAAPYNPLLHPDPDLSLDVEDRPIGGLGIYFVKRLTDQLHYEWTGRGNKLVLHKRT